MLSQIISKSCIMDYPEGSKEEKEKLNKCILKASVDTVFCLTYVVNCWIQYYAGPIVFWIYLLFQVLNTCTRKIKFWNLASDGPFRWNLSTKL